MEKVLLITPTYNEAENIQKFIDYTKKFKELHLLVVDDNSPDGTATIVEKNMQSSDSVKIIKRSGKLGYGSAIIEGYKWGLKNNYYHFVQMDTDFSHRFEDLTKLINEKNNYDLSYLNHDVHLKLCKILTYWPKVVETSAIHKEPHRVAFYLIELSSVFHSLWSLGREYDELRFFQKENDASTYANLNLLKAIKIVICSGLDLFSVSAPKEM